MVKYFLKEIYKIIIQFMIQFKIFKIKLMKN
jgi:hypothetical protein